MEDQHTANNAGSYGQHKDHPPLLQPKRARVDGNLEFEHPVRKNHDSENDIEKIDGLARMGKGIDAERNEQDAEREIILERKAE